MSRKSVEEEISEMELGNIVITNTGTRDIDNSNRDIDLCCSSNVVATLPQKRPIGTYFVIFAGCESVAVNTIYGSVTFPDVCVTRDLIARRKATKIGDIREIGNFQV